MNLFYTPFEIINKGGRFVMRLRVKNGSSYILCFKRISKEIERKINYGESSY
jgi:hypothetical protein